MNDFLNAGIMAAVFTAIFLSGEAVHRKWPARKEMARKTVHLFGGITTLPFPYIFSSHWTVLILCAGFGGILILSRTIGLLRSVHGVSRKSDGAILFPAAIYLVFLLSDGKPFLFIIPILVLAISDTLAALMGKAYGTIHYDVEDNTKSLEGSTAFFMATFLCVHIPLLLMTDLERLHTVLLALIISILVSGFEAISLSGADNIFIPIGTYFVLNKMTSKPLDDIILQTRNLLLVIFAVSLLSIPLKILKPSAIIGLVLLNYAAWSLCDIYWLIPLLLAQFLYLVSVVILNRKGNHKRMPVFQIRAIMYTGILPAILVFTANAMDNYHLVFIPYLTAIAAQMGIIGQKYSGVFNPEGLPACWKKRLYHSIKWTVISVVSIGVVPVHLYLDSAKGWALLLIGSGTLISQFLHFDIREIPWFKVEDSPFKDAPARMISAGCISLIMLILLILFS